MNWRLSDFVNCRTKKKYDDLEELLSGTLFSISHFFPNTATPTIQPQKAPNASSNSPVLLQQSASASSATATNNTPQTIKATPQIRPTISVKGHVSIADRMKAKEEKAEEQEAVLTQISANTPFTQEEMIAVWNKYIRSIEAGRQILINTMEGHKPTLTDKFVLVQQVDNASQEKAMQEEMIDLLNFIRIELKNGKVTLNTSIVENSDTDKSLSPRDYLNQEMEANPALKDVIQEFKFEIEM